jgi:hypothetical protein
MSGWGRPLFTKQVIKLNVKSRRLIYAALEKGVFFNRGTWDGCVFNNITGLAGYERVADYLGDDVNAVTEFIRLWDSTSRGLSRSEANGQLRKALEFVGLDERIKPLSSVTVVRVFTSEETKMVEELHQEIESGAFDELLKELDHAI